MQVNGHDHAIDDRALMELAAVKMLPSGMAPEFNLDQLLESGRVSLDDSPAVAAHSFLVSYRNETGCHDHDDLIAELDRIAYGATTDEALPIFPSMSFDPVTDAELVNARLTPRVIVPDRLYADVRVRIAAGGTGKTTLQLFEAVTLALGRDLWGRETGNPRRTAIVTREDSRQILVARMREIIRAMHLTAAEIAQVLEMVRIIDASGERFRLSCVIDDVVEPHLANIDWLIERLKAFRPDWLVFDPLVSFGVGEGRVNDAEHGMVEAFRICRNRLDCCVEGIHHSGKANAREKTLDQYSGRGGSALADGARMVAVMQPLDASEWQQQTGHTLLEGDTGIVMALPKLSYAGRQDPIYIRRQGYHFEMVQVTKRTAEQAAKVLSDRLFDFVLYEYQKGRRYCTSDLENVRDQIGLTRQEIRAGLTDLKVRGRVIYHEIKGKPGSHYQPVTLAEGDGDTWGKNR